MGKEKRGNQGEYFHKAARNTHTILVLVFKINSLWKMTLELMLISVKKPVYSSWGSCPAGEPKQIISRSNSQGSSWVVWFHASSDWAFFCSGKHSTNFWPSFRTNFCMSSSQACGTCGKSGQNCCTSDLTFWNFFVLHPHRVRKGFVVRSQKLVVPFP